MFVEKVIERASTADLWSLASLLIIGGLMYALSGYFKSVILALKLPGPPTVPFFGNCLLVKERDLLTNRASTAFNLYGPLVRLWVLLFPFFMVLEPHDLQTILSSKKHTNKVFFYRLMHNFLGNGLITNNGNKWSMHRKLIQPTFHLSILEKFVSTFVDATEASFSLLDPSQTEINIVKFVNTCVINILNEAVLGVPAKKNGTLEVEESPFRQGKVVVPYRVTHPWLLIDAVYRMTQTANDELKQKKKLDEFTYRMIQRRRALRKSDPNFQQKCLLDYMIEISESCPDFTEDDIVSEACTFMLAGQDSVGAAVAFCLFTLAQHSEIQQKCYDELEAIFGDDNRPPNMNDLREMKYLEMCIKETLRLYPSVPLFARKTSEDIQVGKHTLPAGSNVFIIPYATHRLPHIYPDPEKFDPERFTSENCEKRHPYAYLPFSAGARNCIGHRFAILEMKTVISKILRSYELLPVPGKTTFEPTFRITLRGSGGLWIRLGTRTAT